MSKNENSTEIAATLVGIYGSISAAADATGVGVSQIHSWVEGATSMSRSFAQNARRLIDDFRLRAKAMHGLMDAVIAGGGKFPEPAAIPLVVEEWELRLGGELNLLSRVLSPLPRNKAPGRALELVRDTLTMSVLPDPWRADRGGIVFYSRRGDDLHVIAIYLDDGASAASKTAWSLFVEE